MQFFTDGGPVMYPLLVCSILVLTVIIERTIFWLTIDLGRDPKLLDEVMELCRIGDWQSVRHRVSGSKDYIIKVLVALCIYSLRSRPVIDPRT